MNASNQREREEYTVSFFENIDLFRWAFKYIRPYWKMLTLSIILMVSVSLLSLIPPFLMKNAINFYLHPTTYMMISHPNPYAVKCGNNYFVPKKNGQYKIEKEKGQMYIVGKNLRYKVNVSSFDRMRIYEVSIIAFEVFLIYLFIFIITYLQEWTSQLVAIRTVNDVRNTLFSHVLRQPMKFFDSNISGRLVTRVTNDVQNLNDMFSKIIASTFKDAVLIAGILYVMFMMNPRLFLILLPVFGFVAFIIYVFRFFSRKAYRIMRAKLAALNAFLAEHLNGMIVTFLFNKEKEKSREFYVINNDYYHSSMKMVFIYAIFRPTIDFTRYFAITLLIWFGAKSIIAGNLEIGTLFAFVSYIGMLFHPINDMAENFSNLQSSMTSVERIKGLLNRPLPQNPRTSFVIKSGDIEVKDLWFSYNDDDWILKDISFKMKDGEKVAIVGHTGAGKSTISSILTGLYEYKRGSVKIGGVEVKECPFEELRKKVNIVLQEVMLFSGSVEDNITLWDKSISREKVLKAVKDLELEKFISSLPDGIETKVREGGTNLSTGQRQLISIIRAFVRDPKVVIMDEATANIDVETEAMIQRAIKKLTTSRTTLIIAHRLSTIRDVSRIIVIHDGKIVEEGSHSELLKLGGVYAKLYRLQNFENIESV
ncbi:ABC transporter ATP-binding protein [Mesoaciditoga sp.]